MDVATRSGTSSRSMGQLGSKDEGLRSEDVEPLSRAEFVALQHSWLAVEGGDSLPPPPPDDKRIISHEQLSRTLHVFAAPGLGRALAARLGAPVGKSVSFAEFWPRVGRLVRESSSKRAKTLLSVVCEGFGLGTGQPEVGSEWVGAVVAAAYAVARAAGMQTQLGAGGGGAAGTLDPALLVTDALCSEGGRDKREPAQALPLSSFLEWLQGSFPLLPDALAAHVYRRLLVPRNQRTKDAILRIAYEGGDTASPVSVWQEPSPPFGVLERPSRLLSEAAVFALMQVSDAFQGPWRLLFDSTEHGLSFNRLVHHLAGYTGPTLVVFRSTAGHVVGGFASTPWHESTSFYGSSSSFVFSASPHFHVYRPSSASCAEANFQYLNATSGAYPHGLGMGGTRHKARLWVGEEVERCAARSLDLTFDMGHMLWTKEGCPDGQGGGDGAFALDSAEVWGLGGEDAAAAQQEHRAQAQAQVERARKVDRGKFLESDFDKEMFFGKTFGGSNGADQQQQ